MPRVPPQHWALEQLVPMFEEWEQEQTLVMLQALETEAQVASTGP